jgi:NADP-dependent 3-hydroxy acid dehydrogenase YdfG
MQPVHQPIALIVGGSSGIGLATAKLLLERTIPTVIVGNRSSKLDQAKANWPRSVRGVVSSELV